MQGLQNDLQTILDAGSGSKELIGSDSRFHLAGAERSKIVEAIEEQTIALSHCYRACMAALQETTKSTGHEYKFIKASDQARLLLGNLGNVQGTAHTYHNIEVNGGKVVAGNMDGNFARDFFN
jgi:hypothetical protein